MLGELLPKIQETGQIISETKQFTAMSARKNGQERTIGQREKFVSNINNIQGRERTVGGNV